MEIKVSLWDRVKWAWVLLRTSKAVGVDPEHYAQRWADSGMEHVSRETNPFLTADEAEAVYDHLEAATEVVWPVLYQTEEGGVLTMRALVYGGASTFTDMDQEAVRGVVFEVVNIVREALSPDQDPDSMPGASFDGEVDENSVKVTAELGAFFDAAIRGDYLAAVRVSDTIRATVGLARFDADVYDTLEDAQNETVLDFVACAMAAVSRQYSLDTYLDEE